MSRLLVGDDDEGHTGIVRHVAEKLLQGFQSARRSADSYNGEAIAGFIADFGRLGRLRFAIVHFDHRVGGGSRFLRLGALIAA